MHDFAETLWFQPEVDITHQSIDKSTTDMLNCMCECYDLYWQENAQFSKRHSKKVLTRFGQD